mmetsp:Transcript_39532/g.104745  ORF Transcript_39532/g.104745 Transcript_39532/m.104745 type:complete len:247 (+) Transcript_39532:2127-2867(+)
MFCTMTSCSEPSKPHFTFTVFVPTSTTVASKKALPNFACSVLPTSTPERSGAAFRMTASRLTSTSLPSKPHLIFTTSPFTSTTSASNMELPNLLSQGAPGSMTGSAGFGFPSGNCTFCFTTSCSLPSWSHLTFTVDSPISNSAASNMLFPNLAFSLMPTFTPVKSGVGFRTTSERSTSASESSKPQRNFTVVSLTSRIVASNMELPNFASTRTPGCRPPTATRTSPLRSTSMCALGSASPAPSVST